MMKLVTQVTHKQQLQQHENSSKQRIQIKAEYPPLTAIGIENLIVLLLVPCDLPFTFANFQEYDDILYAVHPEAAKLLPSFSNTIKSWIVVCFKRQKSLLKDSLQQAVSKIHFTLDLWTSPNHFAFLGVMARFALPSGTLAQTLLALQEMESSHTGETICHPFISIVEEYDIRHCIGYFMIDNNDTFINCLVEKQADSGYFLDSQEYRLR